MATKRSSAAAARAKVTRRSGSAKQAAASCRPSHNESAPWLRRRRGYLRSAPWLRLLPAIRARPGALPALHGAAQFLLRPDGALHHRRGARAAAHRHGGLRGPRGAVRRRRGGERRTPGLAAAPARGQDPAMRARPLFHAGESAAVAHAREAVPRQRRMRRGGLEISRPVDRRLGARVVYRAWRLRSVAGCAALASDLSTSPSTINTGPPPS